MSEKLFHHFYKKTPTERREVLERAGVLTEEEREALARGGMLPEAVANRIVENYVGKLELPLGLGLNYVVNGREVLVPLATEEPSVVAAASYGAKLARSGGGFQVTAGKGLLSGQISFAEVEDVAEVQQELMEKRDELLERANAAYPSLARYGGGARSLDVRIVAADPAVGTPEFLIVDLFVDTAEAMGANMMNTMLESLKPIVEEIVGRSALMAILSNDARASLYTARCTIDPELLARPGISGERVRDRIVAATQLATADPARAVTHNKGIMNGVSALMLATGNDTRAVEAAAHAYAARSGQYRALSSWRVDSNGHLAGELTLPLRVGAVGGTMSTRPDVQLVRQLMGDPGVKNLAEVAVSVGLAQNLAALRALVTEGIQQGHMALQAEALAVAVGARPDEVETLVKALHQAPTIDSDTAKQLLDDLRRENKHE